jgi:hypothetical protein
MKVPRQPRFSGAEQPLQFIAGLYLVCVLR